METFLEQVSRKHKLDKDELCDEYQTFLKKRKIEDVPSQLAWWSKMDESTLKFLKKAKNNAVDYLKLKEPELSISVLHEIAIKAVLKQDMITFRALEEYLRPHPDIRYECLCYADAFEKKKMVAYLKNISKGRKRLEDGYHSTPYDKECDWVCDAVDKYQGDAEIKKIMEAIKAVSILTGQVANNGFGNIVNDDYTGISSNYKEEVKAINVDEEKFPWTSDFLSTFSYEIDSRCQENREECEDGEDDLQSRDYAVIRGGQYALTELVVKLLAMKGNPLTSAAGKRLVTQR